MVKHHIKPKATGKSRRKSALSLVGMVSAAAIAGATPTLAGDQIFVSFAATLSGTAAWDGGPIANCQGAGIASHMGSTTSQCTAELDLQAYGPYDVCTGEGENGYGIPNVNTIVLTAANDDQLVLVSLDIACQITQFSFHGTGDWIVDGDASTGRFAGATGIGELDGNVDFAVGTVQVSVVGEISY